jgi:hypothetical protein
MTTLSKPMEMVAPVAVETKTPVTNYGGNDALRMAAENGSDSGDSDSDSGDSDELPVVTNYGSKVDFVGKGFRGGKSAFRGKHGKRARIALLQHATSFGFDIMPPEDQRLVDAAVLAVTGVPIKAHDLKEDDAAVMIAAMATQATQAKPPKRKAGGSKKGPKGGKTKVARRMVGKKVDGKGGARIPRCPHLEDPVAIKEFRDAFMVLFEAVAKWPVLMANPLLSLFSTAKMGGCLSEELVTIMGEMLIDHCPEEQYPTRLKFLETLGEAPLSVGRTRANCAVPTVVNGFSVDAVLTFRRSTQLTAGNTMPQSMLATARAALIKGAQGRVAVMAAQAGTGDCERE